MNKIILIILIIFTGTALQAQNTTRWLYDYSQPVLSFEGQYLRSSPTIDNPFIKSYFNGDHIGTLMKKETFSRLEDENILGLQNNFRLSLVMPSASGGYTTAWFIEAENKNIAAISFSGDAFRLVFEGNTSFAGDTVKMRDNGYELHAFTQVKGGLVKQYGSNRFKHTLRAALALNTGTRHSALHIGDASVFTASDATLIDLSARIDYSNTKNNSPAFIKVFNGLGAGIDFSYNFKCDKGNNFTVAVSDLGFIRWFSPFTQTGATDTAVSFSGIEIAEILDIEASTSGLNKDSLTAQIQAYTAIKPYISMLPAALHLYYYHEFSPRLEIGAGMKHYFNLWHHPMYFADVKFYVLPSLLIAPTLSYGGYAGFNAGLDMGFNFKAYNLYIGTDYLSPMLDNKMFRGSGYYFKIVRKMGYGPASTKKVKISKTPRRPKYNANVFSNSIINKTNKFTENDTIVAP